MNKGMICFLSFGVIVIILNACKEKSEEVDQKRVIVRYANGKTFCDGFHLIDKYGNAKNRVGVWKFYYVNGALETLLQYNKNGDLINDKTYSEDGKVTYSEATNGNITNIMSYYDN